MADSPGAATAGQIGRRSLSLKPQPTTADVTPLKQSSHLHRLAGRRQPPAEDAAIASLPLLPLSLPKPLSIRNAPTGRTMSRPVRLLITSLGNPPPYHSTRHSAGHVLLRALALQLGFPPLTTRAKEFGNGFLSGSDTRPDWMLWQSPSLMNGSGSPVSKAWKAFTHSSSHDDRVLALVVLHDELEASPGTIKIRRGETSARGHNGIKSVQASLQSQNLGERLVKVGIGIGRPLSRDRDDVSDFVLGPLTLPERAKVEGAASQLVELLEKEMVRLGQL